MMLNQESITERLREIIRHLEGGSLEQAAAALDIPGFERLMRPVRRPDKGPIQFVDPAAGFGVQRVHATGGHIGALRSALRNGNADRALEAARLALESWTR